MAVTAPVIMTPMPKTVTTCTSVNSMGSRRSQNTTTVLWVLRCPDSVRDIKEGGVLVEKIIGARAVFGLASASDLEP